MQQRRILEQKHPFVDISYREISGDILSSAEKIYRAANLELSGAARAAINDWDAKNPPHKQGLHRYSLGAVGLDEGDVRTGFAEYIEQFGKWF